MIKDVKAQPTSLHGETQILSKAPTNEIKEIVLISSLNSGRTPLDVIALNLAILILANKFI